MIKLFTDKYNNEKNITNINYKDIQNLIKNDVHEGFYIDYKKEYNVSCQNRETARKAKMDLCDDICSFANNEGGWLIYGIEELSDRSLQDAPIQKIKFLDYNQQVSEILKNGKVFPMPNFETKFIKLPTNQLKGYFLIHVFEGIYPPYISNGKIKTRVGSSGASVDISDRKSLDALYEKRNNKNKENTEFCKREIYYAPTYMDRFQTKHELPMINFYLKSNSSKQLRNFKEIEDIAKQFCEDTIFHAYYYTAKSIVFFNSDIDTTATATVTAELFFDFSFKLHIPLIMHDEDVKQSLISKLPEKFLDYKFERYKFVNYYKLQEIIYTSFDLLNQLAIKKHLNLSDFLLTTTYENTQNSLLIEDNENYFKFVCERGLRRSMATNCKIENYLKNYLNKKKLIDIFPIINELIFMHFGFLITDINAYNLFKNLDEFTS